MNFVRIRRIALRILGLLVVALAVLMLGIYYFRDRIFQKINQEISSHIKGTFLAESFGVVYWEDGSPGLTLILENVSLKDRQFDTHQVEFLNVKEVRVRLNLIDLFNRRIQIRHIKVVDGTLQAYRLKSGYANWNIFEPDSTVRITPKSKKNGFLVDIRRVKFENVQIHFADSLYHKWYGGNFKETECLINRKNNLIKGRIRGNIRLDGLAFNEEKGSFGTNQETDLWLNLQLDTTSRRLTLTDSRLVFEKKDTLNASGFFQFHKGTPPDLNLLLTVNRMPLVKALDLMPQQLAASIGKFRYYPEIRRATVHLTGSTGPRQQPTVFVTFKSGPARFESVLGLLTHTQVEGRFTNRLNRELPASNANSRLYFKRFDAHWEDGLPVGGEMVIHDLTHPRAYVRVNVDTDLSYLNDNLNSSKYGFQSGTIQINAQYRGAVNHVIDKKTGNLAGILRGQLHIKDGVLRYYPRHFIFEKLTANGSFNEKDLRFDEIKTLVNGSPVLIRGKIQKLIPFLTVPDSRIYAKAEIFSPNINFSAARMPVVPRTPKRLRKKARKELIAKIDRIIDRLETDVSLQINQFQYRQFKASRIQGRMHLSGQKLQIRNLAMNAFGGTFNFLGTINYYQNNPSQMDVSCVLRNTDIQQLLWGFDNFQQKTLTHQNIRGIWNSDGRIKVKLRPDYTFIPGTFDGHLNFTLREGELLNFKPLKTIQRYIFKSRNFDHVRFATLSNQFRFKGREIEMNKMGIESSVLTLFMGGTYSFGNKTDMFVQIPLRNLRRRGKDYELLDLNGQDVKGWTLNLRAKDEGDETKIRLDLGQRVRERKNKRLQMMADTANFR